ncbi:hypothetical protein FOMPIDRAFT_1018807 [Fomitopsis schrenkii]|uniref:Uncharacterized protein n=1 Tax=Fomitopsis schrenkii TaxID=2126942 RepID=S8DT44_FOMSC|nr:hypothetical protein FOMPIDRAFT_1018807 [Fomitopsis schrenkii]
MPQAPPPINNRYVTFTGQLQSRHIKVEDPVKHVTHLYSIDTFRNCVRFNNKLRQSRATQLSKSLTQIPGGYPEMVLLWNRDQQATHHFCKVDLTTLVFTIVGTGIDPAHLDSYAPPLQPRIIERESSHRAGEEDSLMLHMVPNGQPESDFEDYPDPDDPGDSAPANGSKSRTEEQDKAPMDTSA